MKTIILLLTLITLTACGQKSSNATLEVTHGFAFTSTGFGGGLIVSGQNLSTGQRFSSALNTGTSVSLNLPNGDWQFYAMGFETAGMTGNRKCGLSKASLAGTDTKVGITITAAGCADSAFGPNTSFTFTGCGAFYDYNSGTDIYTPISSTTSPSFCSSLAKDLQGKSPQSYRLVAFNSPLGAGDGTDGFLSTCQNMGPANWPRYNIPFAIVLYSDNSCTIGKEINRYAFPGGFGNGSPQFDSQFYGSSNNYFVLPTNKMRRGFSPFMSMLPKIACSSGECLAQPSAVPGQRFIYSSGTTRIYVDETNATGACVAAVTGGDFGYTTCGLEGKRAYADITSTCASTACSGTVTVTIGSTPLTTVGLWSSNQPFLANAYEIFNGVWQAVGIRNYTSGTTDQFFRYFQYDDKDRYYGEIGEARSMLGPDGVGGPLATIAQSCTSLLSKAPFTQMVTMNEDGVTKTYRVDVASSVASFPSFICDTSVVGSCGSALYPNADLNVKIYRSISGVNTLIHRMDLLCNNKVGTLENVDDDDLASGLKRSKRLFWNTMNQTTARFEKFGIEYKAGNIYRADSRVFQMSSSADYFTTRAVSFESRFNGSVWEQRAFNEEIKREYNSGEKISRQSESATYTDPSFDFASASFATFGTHIDFGGSTPGTNSCLAVGSSAGQMQGSFSAIAVSSGCSSYATRSGDISSISGYQHKPANFVFSTYKQLFPLLGL